MSTSSHKIWYFVGILLAGNLTVWTALLKSHPRDFANLYFFDVGQGDAFYLRTPQGNDVLIDGGPGDVVLAKLGKYMPFTDRSLELVILTHPHADHLSGLVEVLRRYRVKQILFSEVFHDSATYQKFLQLFREKKIKHSLPRLGQRFFLDDYLIFDVYHPVLAKFSRQPADLNDVSLVGKLSLGQSNILLAGDAGRDVENLMLNLHLPLKSEILKIGHHGSRHSTSWEFLNSASSTYTVISVGPNRYGHPHEEVLGLLKTRQTKVLRTDESGDIGFLIYPHGVVLQER